MITDDFITALTDGLERFGVDAEVVRLQDSRNIIDVGDLRIMAHSDGKFWLIEFPEIAEEGEYIGLVPGHLPFTAMMAAIEFHQRPVAKLCHRSKSGDPAPAEPASTAVDPTGKAMTELRGSLGKDYRLEV